MDVDTAARAASPSPTVRAWLVAACFALAAAPVALAPGSLPADAAYVGAMGALAAILTTGARRCDGHAGRGWRLVAAAVWCWLLGDVVQRVLAAAGRAELAPSPADALWLLSYPLLAGGLAVMLRGRRIPAPLRREIGLDVAVVTLAGSLVTWTLVVAPQGDGTAVRAATVVAQLYPVGDITLLAAALTLLMAPGRRSTAGSLLIACLGGTLVLDAAFSVVPALLPSFPVDRLDGALLLCNGLLAVAVLHPSAAVPAAPPPPHLGPQRLHRWRVVLLGSALVTVNLALAVPAPDASAASRTATVLVAVATSLVVVTRLYRVVRDREVAEAKLAHQATHDQLTGLANRALLLDRLDRDLRSPSGDDDALLLLYLDLDGFKAVNDRHGHAAGDVVLHTVGRRLQEITRRGDTVARLGGDEFVVLCHGVAAGEADPLGHKLCDAVCRPIALPDGASVSVGASVGVVPVRVPHDASGAGPAEAERALVAADAAMYRAKHSGGGVRLADR